MVTFVKECELIIESGNSIEALKKHEGNVGGEGGEDQSVRGGGVGDQGVSEGGGVGAVVKECELIIESGNSIEALKKHEGKVEGGGVGVGTVVWRGSVVVGCIIYLDS